MIVYLPHDGVATNNITGKRYIDHWTEAGFECGTPIKNTGAGAAMMRIEAARRVFPRCWFNDSATEAGLPNGAACLKASGMAITGTAAGRRK